MMEEKNREAVRPENLADSPEKEISKKANNWKIIKLSKPLEHLGSQVTELDLTGLDDLTLNDLNELYNTYELMGGGGTVMQETSLLFAELVAQRLTRLPLETLGTMRAKDAIKLKNRIYRFFFM